MLTHKRKITQNYKIYILFEMTWFVVIGLIVKIIGNCM